MSTFLGRAPARLLVLPLAASLFLLAPTQPAPAHDRAPSTVTVAHPIAGTPIAQRGPGRATTRPSARQVRKAARAKLTKRVVRATRSRLGKPYRYGASGPNAFDCSGLTQWVYRKAGHRLPRTSGAQASATRRVRNPRRGDLVFFHNGGRVYHVGIYAGHHRIWHASRPGTPVRKERIWTGSVFYGRVR